MQFSAAIFSAALIAMKWLFGLTAALLLVLTATQWLRGDADARPAMTLSLAFGFALLSILSAVSSRRFEEAIREADED